MGAPGGSAVPNLATPTPPGVWPFRVRLAVVTAVGLAAIAVPEVGENHVAVGLLLLVFALPMNLVVRRITRQANPAGWLDVVATLTASAAAFIEPSVWPAAMLFQMLNAAGSVAFLAPRWTFTLGATSMIPMTAIAILHPGPSQVAMLVVAGLVLPALILSSNHKSEKDKAAAESVRVLLERQHEIVTRMSAMLIAVDDPSLGPEAKVVDLIDRFGWVGNDGQTAIGQRFGDLMPAIANHPEVRKACANLRSEPLVLDPIALPEEDGTRHVEVELFTLTSGGAVLLIEDVSQREASTAMVRYQASHDQLTGLANRDELMERVSAELTAKTEVSLLLIDLNGFKDINDTLGHYAGDELLKIVSQRLQRAVRRDDIVARLGGDEFAVLLSNIETERLTAMVEEISRRTRESTIIGNASVGTSASIGVARAPLDATDAEALLQCADIAMYEAKRSQSDYRFYEAALSTAPERLDLLAEIAPAFERGEMTAYVQPKVSVATGRVTGAEVLMRWDHPTRGVLAPASFLDIVSVAGLLDELARHALWRAVQTAAEVHPDISIAVNMSAVNLRRVDLAEQIDNALASHGVAPHRLIVELTESEVIDETGVLHRTLAQIAELGVGISVDDFGTGYSSFSHLRSLPLTELKIDQRFVGGMVGNRSDEVIVASMVELGHNLGLSVCAEGVEDVATAQRLQELGCDVAQGYFFGRPMPATDFARWLHRTPDDDQPPAVPLSASANMPNSASTS